MANLMQWGLGVAAGALLATGCATTRAAAPDKIPVAAVAGDGGESAAPDFAAARVVKSKGEAFTSSDLGFELDKPSGGEWALATNVTSPEGRPIPVVVAHPKSGAQIVVQVSEPVDSPKALATMLRDKLAEENALKLGDPRKIAVDSGSQAYGFDFAVKGEAAGRVAVIEVGTQIILVVASWPEGAAKPIVEAVDSVVKSVRTPANADPVMMRPDKA